MPQEDEATHGKGHNNGYYYAKIQNIKVKSSQRWKNPTLIIGSVTSVIVAIIGTMGLIAVANKNHFANPSSSANIPRYISSIIWSLKTKLTEPNNRSSNNNNISNKSIITHRSKGSVADT